jgi:hypothetical protein
MKKLTLISVLLLIFPIFSFAAISEQEKNNFQYTYGNSEVNPEVYTKILDFCDKNDTNIDSCLSKLRAQSTSDAVTQPKIKGRLCCLNVSGFIGEYTYLHGQAYCIPPC